jgi:4-hydroxybenzoyl-CoA thioesterase/acyl-CoA thioester hydrolase
VSHGSPRFEAQRRVEFRDTDAAAIVHFSAFFPMMESVEHEFLRSIGVTVLPAHDDVDGLTWPRISVGCDFHGPARFEDLLDFAVFVDRVGSSSVSYRFEITCRQQPVATGKIVAVCCRLAAGGNLTKAAIPDALRRQLLGN